MIIIYSESEIQNKPVRDCIKLFPTESINVGTTGVIIANYSFETKYIFSTETKLKNSMKVDSLIQEEDLK